MRESGFCRRIIGYGYREPSLRKGLELGIIDAFTLDLDEVIAGADLLVICTPTLVAARVLEEILPQHGTISGFFADHGFDVRQFGKVHHGIEDDEVSNHLMTAARSQGFTPTRQTVEVHGVCETCSGED